MISLRTMMTEDVAVNVSRLESFAIGYSSADGGEIDVEVSFQENPTDWIAIKTGVVDGDIVTNPSTLPADTYASFRPVWVRFVESAPGTHTALLSGSEELSGGGGSGGSGPPPGSIDLQEAYDNGNTILVAAAAPVRIQYAALSISPFIIEESAEGEKIFFVTSPAGMASGGAVATVNAGVDVPDDPSSAILRLTHFGTFETGNIIEAESDGVGRLKVYFNGTGLIIKSGPAQPLYLASRDFDGSGFAISLGTTSIQFGDTTTRFYLESTTFRPRFNDAQDLGTVDEMFRELYVGDIDTDVTATALRLSVANTLGLSLDGAGDGTFSRDCFVPRYSKIGQLFDITPDLPTATLEAGAGAAGTPTITIDGGDTFGLITLNTATSPTLNADIFNFVPDVAYVDDPAVILFPANALAAAQNVRVYVDESQTSEGGWTLKNQGTALTEASTYLWYYHVGSRRKA